MSQAPAMPVFTDALLGDTMHLSAEEFGAYCLLLFATWRNNGIPLDDDPKRLSRVCRMTEKRWVERMRPALVGFFDISGGTWRQKRLEKEWGYVNTFSAKQRANSNVRWAKVREAKLLENNECGDPTEHANDIPNGYPHTHKGRKKEDDANASSKKEGHGAAGAALMNGGGNGHDRTRRGSRLPPDWKPDESNCQFARDLGLDPASVTPEFCDFWHGVPGSKGCKLDWDGTYRNRCRELARSRQGGGNARGRQDVRGGNGLVAAAADVMASIRNRR